MWPDCIKAFDSVPQKWLIYALKLVKMAKQLVNAIEHFTAQWSTIVYLKAETEIIRSGFIKFFEGIFQGNSLSVLFSC